MIQQQRISALISALLGCTMLISVANAQPMFRGEPGMMGPHVIGPGYGRMCGPGPAGFVEWRLQELAPALKLTDAQRTKLDELRAASAKSAQGLQGSCEAATASTVPGRMEAMEKRMEAMLAASKAVRPALDAFYSSLTDDQKAHLDRRTGRHRFWRWRDKW